MAIAVLAGALLGAHVHAQQTDPAPAVPAAESAAGAADASALQAMRRARDAQVAGREYPAALKVAQDVVAAQQQSPHDVPYAIDLAALGRIHAELREVDAAESRYLEALALIAKAEGEFTPTLIDVYRGLGRSYIRGARYAEAVTTLETAQNISQRNLGLFNVEQSPLLDDITTAYLGLGDTTEAQRRQLDRLDNAVRRFGADDPRVIPFRYVLGNYYERSRLPESAEKQYEEVLKSQTATHGDTDAALLGPLRRIVKIDLLISQVSKTEHRDQLATLVDHVPDGDAVERGLSLAVLGDWATVANDATGAREYYSQAWAALAQEPQFDVGTYFSAPTMIDFVAPLNAVDRNTRSRPYAWTQVQFNFNVSPEGLPSNVTIVGLGDDRDPTPIQSQYDRRLRETHFRPRLVAGNPALTTSVKSTHYFRYYVEKEKKTRGKGKGRDDDAGADDKKG
ncbi:MAG: tetratricopeptide repeat protein [Gammaproteobacteria bacterium]